MLRAYFDESGLHSTAVFALAGYVAPEKDWQRFENKWRALLQSPLRYQNPKISPQRAAIIGRPLEFLHATEMDGMGKGRFRAMGQENRGYLKATSVDLILRSGSIGVASAIILPEYERLSAKEKEVIGDPYVLCFQHVVTQVCKKAKVFLGEDHSEGIAYVFEQQAVWQNLVNEMWIKSVEQGYKKKYRMGSITFGDKRDFLPLQAADRNAFETYQHFADPASREIWRKFMNGPQHNGQFFDRDGFSSLIQQLKIAGRL